MRTFRKTVITNHAIYRIKERLAPILKIESDILLIAKTRELLCNSVFCCYSGENEIYRYNLENKNWLKFVYSPNSDILITVMEVSYD